MNEFIWFLYGNVFEQYTPKSSWILKKKCVIFKKIEFKFFYIIFKWGLFLSVSLDVSILG